MSVVILTNKRKYSCDKGIDASLFLEYDMQPDENSIEIEINVNGNKAVKESFSRSKIKEAQMLINRECGNLSLEKKELPPDLVKKISNILGPEAYNSVGLFSVAGELFVDSRNTGEELCDDICFLLNGIDWKAHDLHYNMYTQAYDCRRTIGYICVDEEDVPVNVHDLDIVAERFHYYEGKYPTLINNPLCSILVGGVSKRSAYSVGDNVLFGDGIDWKMGIIARIHGNLFTVDREEYFHENCILCLYDGHIPDLDFLIEAEKIERVGE